MDTDAVARVLTGLANYDDLGSPEEQAAVRVAWEAAIEDQIRRLDYEARFSAAGQEWVESDEDGSPVHRRPRAAGPTE